MRRIRLLLRSNSRPRAPPIGHVVGKFRTPSESPQRPGYEEEAKQRCAPLGNDGAQCHPPHTKPQAENEKHVQHQVGDRQTEVEIHGGPHFLQTKEDPQVHQVDEKTGHTVNPEREVFFSKRLNSGARLKQAEHAQGERPLQQNDERTQTQGDEPGTSHDRYHHIGCILVELTVGLRNQSGGAHAQKEEHPVQRRKDGRPNRHRAYVDGIRHATHDPDIGDTDQGCGYVGEDYRPGQRPDSRVAELIGQPRSVSH